jgi:hypothetical protein
MIAIDDRSYLYPHAWPSAADAVDADGPASRAALAAEVLAGIQPRVDGQLAERAVIGNDLRIPAVWCEFGPCIGRYADTAALGQADVTARALAAGWRHDALGRLACPVCVQQDTTFIVVYPVALHVPAAEAASAESSYALRYSVALGYQETLPAEADRSWDGDAYGADFAFADDADDCAAKDWAAKDWADTDWADTPSRPLRRAVIADVPSSKAGWFRHRDAGRHRQRL